MKKMLALVLSLVMVFGLVGCGKNAGGSDNDGSTKLTVWYWGEQEIPGYKQYMEEMAQKYSSETDGISVEVVLQESDTLYSALRTASGPSAPAAPPRLSRPARARILRSSGAARRLWTMSGWGTWRLSPTI